MRDPFANYDNWLTTPMEKMITEGEHFLDWADNQGYNLDDPMDLLTAKRHYEDYKEDMAEAEAEAKYEASLERGEMDHWDEPYEAY